jgi:protein gp37
VSKNSDIQWTDHTFNPWWGCVEDGPECDHCYARAWAKRTGSAVWGHDAPRRFFGEKHWTDPAKWAREAQRDGVTRRVFCGSMCDIGERRNDAVGAEMDAARARLWPIIEQTRSLTWLLLTKRPQNIPSLVPATWMTNGFPSNVWCGTTAGNQDGWNKRVKYLRRIPVGVRFVSCEPMLGPLDVSADLDGISWIISGGESGGNARNFDLRWARSLRDQCQASGVAFFMKQAGAAAVDTEFKAGIYAPSDKRTIAASKTLGTVHLVLLKDGHGGDPAEWEPGLRVREFPKVVPL